MLANIYELAIIVLKILRQKCRRYFCVLCGLDFPTESSMLLLRRLRHRQGRGGGF